MQKYARWRSSSWAWNCSTCPVAPTRKLTTSPGEHPSGYPKSLASSRNDSSNLRRHRHYRAQHSLGRSPLNRLPREPRPVARPQGHACSWCWSLRRDVGPRSSRITWCEGSCRKRRRTRNAWRGKPPRTASSMVSYIARGPMMFHCGASPGNRGLSC